MADKTAIRECRQRSTSSEIMGLESGLTNAQRKEASRQIRELIQRKIRDDWDVSCARSAETVVYDDGDGELDDDPLSEGPGDDAPGEDGSSSESEDERRNLRRNPRPTDTWRWRQRDVSPSCWQLVMRPGSSSSPSGSADDMDWEAPNEGNQQVGKDVEKDQARRLRLKRRRLIEAEMERNPAFRHWTAQRDSWSGARLRIIRRPAQNSQASDSSLPSEAPGLSHSSESRHSPAFLDSDSSEVIPFPEFTNPPESVPSSTLPESPEEPRTPESARRGRRPALAERPYMGDSDDVMDWNVGAAAPPSKPEGGDDDMMWENPRKRVDVREEVPVGIWIFPRTNLLRVQILPKYYPQIYSKCVIRGQTPAVPINLADMTRALVQGWKSDGTWLGGQAGSDPHPTKTARRVDVSPDVAPTAQMQSLVLEQKETKEEQEPEPAQRPRSRAGAMTLRRSMSLTSASPAQPPPVARSAVMLSRMTPSPRRGNADLKPITGRRRRESTPGSGAGEREDGGEDSHGEGNSQLTVTRKAMLVRGVGAVKRVFGGLRGRSRGYDTGRGHSRHGSRNKMRMTIEEPSDADDEDKENRGYGGSAKWKANRSGDHHKGKGKQSLETEEKEEEGC